MEVKLLLVDDHLLFRAGLRALLKREEGFVVVGEASDGRTGVRMVGELHPHVVVMDLRMPDLNGIEATRQTILARPGTKVIGLSGNADHRSAAEMFRAGASGFLPKEAAFDELVTAIRSVMHNNVYMSPALAAVGRGLGNGGADAGPGESVFAVLSPREREVLQLLAEGKSTKELAGMLHVSVKTAETHRRNLMEKLQIDNVAELTKYALREGITQL
jgi:two-component system, NarL family, response regulator NreC